MGTIISYQFRFVYQTNRPELGTVPKSAETSSSSGSLLSVAPSETQTNVVNVNRTSETVTIENEVHSIYKAQSTGDSYIQVNGQWVLVPKPVENVSLFAEEIVPVDRNVENNSPIENNSFPSELKEQLLSFMSNVSLKLVNIEKTQEIIMTHFKFEESKSNGCSKCAHCNPSILEGSSKFPFEKIKDEDELDDLEKRLEEEKYKADFLNFCHSIIGAKRNKDEFINCCLELSRAIFDKAFWTLTTWNGISKSDVVKFKLSTHAVFLNLFKFVIRETIEFTAADKQFALFFQGRTKNAKQSLKSDATRMTSSRSRAPNAPKIRKIQPPADPHSGDVSTNQSENLPVDPIQNLPVVPIQNLPVDSIQNLPVNLENQIE